MSFPNQVFDTMRVRVHFFEVYSPIEDKMIVPLNNGRRSKRTEDDIRSIQGVVVPDSAELIDPKLLDNHGRYYPPENGQ